MKRMLAHVSTLIAMIGICISAASFAHAETYVAKQKVEWRDDNMKFGGGWIPATILKDLGPNIVERYHIHFEGKDKYYDTDVRGSLLRPAQAPLPDVRPVNPQVDNNADAKAAFHVGDEVEWRDDNMKFGGGWIPATIRKDLGPDIVERYVVSFDGKDAYYNDNIRPSLLRPRQKAVPPPDVQPPVVKPPQPIQPAPRPDAAAPQPAKPLAQNSLWNQPAPKPVISPPENNVPPWRKNERPTGNTQVVVGPDGQKHSWAMAGPGDEMPFGSWRLNSSGQRNVVDTKVNPDGSKTGTAVWEGPSRSNNLAINPDGTWVRSFGQEKEQGTWKDLGNNIVELTGYEGETWTASTWQGQIYLKHPTAKFEYGARN